MPPASWLKPPCSAGAGAFGDDDLEIADHLRDRLIDEVPQIGEAMGADIADHAGAGLRLVVTPGEGDLRSAQKVRAEGAAVIARCADLAVRDQPPGERLDGVLDVVEAHHRDDARLLGGLRHRERSLRVVGEGLLAIDVLAGGNRGHRDVEVEIVRGVDVDNVDGRIVDDLPPVRRVAAEAELPGRAARDLVVHVGEDLEHGNRRLSAECEWLGAVAHGMGLAHPAGTHESDFQLWHSVLQLTIDLPWPANPQRGWPHDWTPRCDCRATSVHRPVSYQAP